LSRLLLSALGDFVLAGVGVAIRGTDGTVLEQGAAVAGTDGAYSYTATQTLTAGQTVVKDEHRTLNIEHPTSKSGGKGRVAVDRGRKTEGRSGRDDWGRGEGR
jgi:hypothetical protein